MTDVETAALRKATKNKHRREDKNFANLMACMIGGEPDDFLPSADPTEEEIKYAKAAEEKYQALRAEMKNAKPNNT